jgi:Flp pilus assembly protein CpaB
LATAPAPARPRPGGGRLFIIVGLLLAVLAGGGVFLLGSLASPGGGLAGPSQSIVVAATDIPLRAPITATDLTTEKVSGVFTNVYTKPSDVVELIAQVNIHKGTIITSDMLAKDVGLLTAGSAPAYLPLAPGYVALTIPTSEQQGVAGHVVIGDYITVIAAIQITTFKTNPGTAQTGSQLIVKTVFHDLRIIGVGPASINVQPASGTTATTNAGPVGGVTSSLTIEMTQCDAEYMEWFLNVASQLKYTLESFKDYQPAPTAADPTCANVAAAKGVTANDVNTRYRFTG